MFAPLTKDSYLYHVFCTEIDDTLVLLNAVSLLIEKLTTERDDTYTICNSIISSDRILGNCSNLYERKIVANFIQCTTC